MNGFNVLRLAVIMCLFNHATSTADKWYKLGFRTIEDVRQSQTVSVTDTQRLGVKYYHHLSVPVTREETEYIRGFVFSQADMCFPGTTVEAAGGYRR